MKTVDGTHRDYGLDGDSSRHALDGLNPTPLHFGKARLSGTIWGDAVYEGCSRCNRGAKKNPR